MSSVRFFLSCIPPTATHHAKKLAKRGKFYGITDKPELVAAKATLDALLIPFQRPTITGPVVLTLVYTWPWLKGARKRDIAKGRIPHTSRPDCSNLVKTLEDRLVQLKFIEDDNAVVELHVQKWWGDTPGIDIQIRTVDVIEAAPLPTVVEDADAFFGRFNFEANA